MVGGVVDMKTGEDRVKMRAKNERTQMSEVEKEFSTTRMCHNCAMEWGMNKELKREKLLKIPVENFAMKKQL